MRIKYFCDDCDCELEPVFEDKVSEPFTELIPKDAPLSHLPIVDLIRLEEFDDCERVTYTYNKTYNKS
jgi:hypothetical protein